MNTKKLAVPLAALALMLSAGGGFVAAAHADTTTTATASTASASAPTDQGTHPKPAAVGTVTAIDGNTITLTDKMSNATYTIDASSATIQKHEAPSSTSSTSSTPTAPAAPTTISVSDIAVGDTLMVQGTVSGSTITATKIDDGQMGFGGRGGMGGPGHESVHGTVTAVNGTTLTVQNADGTSYTVDASSATASKIETMSVSDVSVGDSVDIDGTISGTTVTAKRLTDGVPAEPAPTATTAATSS